MGTVRTVVVVLAIDVVGGVAADEPAKLESSSRRHKDLPRMCQHHAATPTRSRKNQDVPEHSSRVKGAKMKKSRRDVINKEKGSGPAQVRVHICTRKPQYLVNETKDKRSRGVYVCTGAMQVCMLSLWPARLQWIIK